MISDFFRRITGIKDKDEQVHRMKNKTQVEVLEIQRQVKALHKYIEESTAYKVAKATGRIK